MIDLENRDQMMAYLNEKKVLDEGDNVFYCKGGVSCVAALIEKKNGQTLLIKQGRAKLAVKEEWLADPARMAVEARANDFYNKFIPESAPAVLSYDDENCIMIREAAPADARMWKQDLMEGILDFEVAKKTMEALAKVQNGTADNPEIAKQFDDYSVFHQLRISPYIDFLVGKYPELKDDAEKLKDSLLNVKRVVVHADYSPKNIMTMKDRSICILDYEIAHYGNPAFDVAFFTNHIILKSAHFRKLSDAFLNMLIEMTDTFFANVTFTDPKQLEAECMPILAFMMLARIDGKSPVEYITCESTKQLVRDMALRLLRSDIKTYREAAELFRAMEKSVAPCC